MATRIISTNPYSKSVGRGGFEVPPGGEKLKVFIKSKTVIYDVPLYDEAVIEKEEFCASKFTFYVLKDNVMSFDQGDVVSVKYNDTGIFYGYVFLKERNKEGMIKVVCYDQMRYMKNRRTYTRDSMRLDEAVKRIGAEYDLRMGEIDECKTAVPALAADNISLLDVVKRACSYVRRTGGRRYILYDDFGYLRLRDESGMMTDIMLDASQAEDFVYRDTIDKDTYNAVELYSDKKRLNVRYVTGVSDAENMKRWGSLILSQHTTQPELAKQQGENLLLEYNRINRSIMLKNTAGDARMIPGCSVYVKMAMGDLAFDGYVRVRKVTYRFTGDCYFADVYIDGSEID